MLIMKQFFLRLSTLFSKNMLEDKSISLKIWTEKVEGHGEDAPPLLVMKGDACAVGVFDGMGGSGAALCESAFGEGYTKAYVASRIVASSMKSFLDNHLPTDDISVEDMKAVVKIRLNEEQDSYPPKNKSSLRSKLVRDYPTTLAIVTLQKQEKMLQIDSYWAGDSRCYLWTDDGLYQISKDDLEEDNDPMDNLRNDSAISNCICGDRDFQINHKQIDLKKQPVMIICATDGCFGYYPTPMHFEYILKRSLQEAKDTIDWKNRIVDRIQKVTGDDASLALIGIGFDTFKQVKSMANKQIKGFDKIRERESKIKKIKNELEKEKEIYINSIESGWEKYKKQYMMHLNDE